MTWEPLLAAILTAPDPVAALKMAQRRRGLSTDLRRRLAAIDEDGLRISALLVVRLRFERLLRGSPVAERWFDEDPADFAAAFRVYHSAVKPTAFFPQAEGALFAEWLQNTRR